jgi:opacity protein-like surface antigen|tara:strand:- start:7140 stop:7556 length:417 start_codon:yes stop_codon:yes gene_type:complete
MNKLFLTAMLALITTFASAQFVALTTITEVEEEYNFTDKIGVGYNVSDKLMVGITMNGEDKYKLLGRYNMYNGLWATCIYDYESDSDTDMSDKLDLGIGYSYNVWRNLYIDPYYVMPLKEDNDGKREGEFKLGVSYKF